ncbi:hypothetical protein R5R42_05260 [Oenococcus oeni]|uniref:hypothetical protein n=3 Tax=Oenococcus oeni TaxID=1247 RepID=UPI0008F88333|nr:hypothetical protein [Oenococcus oeni]OIK84779.1 hypothetical protein ATW78_09880 [Oenococcus oeni]OIL33326.1 hypothetical protein ATX08_09980 [Oenococcus oeni]OLQ35067.1 hypothetical protein ATX09_07415 [Oenococcus oeni]
MNGIFLLANRELRHLYFLINDTWKNHRTEIDLCIVLFLTGYVIFLGGVVNGSSLFSVDQILLAILLPLVFFLVNSGQDDPITPFDKRVIFEKIINAKSVFVVLTLLVVPAILWDRYCGIVLWFLLFFYLLGLFLTFRIFLKSYYWLSSSHLPKESFRNKVRKNFVDSSLRNKKIDVGELWEDFFNQRKFIRTYNASDTHPFKLTFMFDYDFMQQFFKTIKRIHSNPKYDKENDHRIDSLLRLWNDNLLSFYQAGDPIASDEMIKFYMDCLKNYSSESRNHQLRLDRDFWCLRTVFNNYIKFIFGSASTGIDDNVDDLYKENFFDTVERVINKYIDENPSKDKNEQEKVIDIFVSFVSANANAIFKAYDGKGDFPFPETWAITPAVLDALDQNKKKSTDFQETAKRRLRHAWLQEYRFWILNGKNLYVQYNPEEQLNFIPNKQQIISEHILAGFNLKVVSNLLMLLNFVIPINPGELTNEILDATVQNLLNCSKTFGYISDSFPVLTTMLDEKAENQLSDVDPTYRLMRTMFPQLKHQKDLDTILAFFKSEALGKKYETDSRKTSLIVHYQWVLEKLQEA